jgi:hypothetical protein
MSFNDETKDADHAVKLAACEKNFCETGNGLYAWAAIYLCLADGIGSAHEFPSWLRTYLLESAIGLRFLADRRNAVTRPKRDQFDSDDTYIKAMKPWGQDRINFTEAAELAPVLLKLKAPGKGAKAQGSNLFLKFSKDMEGYDAAILHRAVGQVRAAKLAKGSDIDCDSSEARNVRRLARRGKSRVP